MDYVAGINQYIAEARTDPNKMPFEYGAIGKTLEDWTGTDVIGTASLVGGIFGKGGGGELGAAVALEEAKDRFGGAAGEQAWQDFRRRDDPEAPTTVKSGNGSFDYPTSGARQASRFPTKARWWTRRTTDRARLSAGSAACWAASASSAACPTPCWSPARSRRPAARSP